MYKITRFYYKYRGKKNQPSLAVDMNFRQKYKKLKSFFYK